MGKFAKAEILEVAEKQLKRLEYVAELTKKKDNTSTGAELYIATEKQITEILKLIHELTC